MNDFVFKFIFESEKDKAFPNSRVFRMYIQKKYGIVDIFDGTKLYIAINKYQLKKYGRSVNPNDYIDLTKETLQHKRDIRRSVKYKKIARRKRG